MVWSSSQTNLTSPDLLKGPSADLLQTWSGPVSISISPAPARSLQAWFALYCLYFCVCKCSGGNLSGFLSKLLPSALLFLLLLPFFCRGNEPCLHLYFLAMLDGLVHFSQPQLLQVSGADPGPPRVLLQDHVEDQTEICSSRAAAFFFFLMDFYFRQ